MTITLGKIEKLLKEKNLLKEFIYNDSWHYNLPIENQTITKLSYNSKETTSTTLFFCKGLTFKESYLNFAVDQGLEFYISETPYETKAKLGIIVTNIRQAMALISMHFYGLPQEKLTLIGITGTKGKTTTAYFTKYILDESTNLKTAMLSTMNTTLDGLTYFKSSLTTPESLDLYRMMAEAVNNNMSHLVMEVSSQAYKLERVYGLTFDVGIFLNISPDHISPIEHPTFDDYYYCKRQLIENSKKMVINADCQDFKLLKEFTESKGIPLYSYGEKGIKADYNWTKKDLYSFHVEAQVDELNLIDDYSIKLMGDFNKDNALASLIVTGLVGATKKNGQSGLLNAHVPGRMETLKHPNGAQIIIDYAHNYLSLKKLLSFAKEAHPDGKIITVIGSTGGKAISRRADFGKVLSELTDIAFLTSDDPSFEDPEEITKEISQAITNDLVKQYIIIDRKKAIEEALKLASSNDVVILAGKGQDLYQKINGVDIPYEGDTQIAQDFINSLS